MSIGIFISREEDGITSYVINCKLLCVSGSPNRNNNDNNNNNNPMVSQPIEN